MGIKHWELYYLSVIKGQKRGFISSILRFCLWLLSCPFQLGVSLRNWMFDRGLLRSYTPPVALVISVGNITAGGTGKTPVTLLIAEELHNQVNLAILSRGYRSQAEKFSVPLLLNKTKGALHPASLCGDEPFLLAENLPNANVIVGRNRFQSSKMAARLGAEVIVLDDGMQHRGIARDLEVVVMDLLDPFGQGYFLPRGLMREGLTALGRADLIILNNVQDHERFEAVKRQISHATSAPVVGTQVDVVSLYDLTEKPLSLKPGTKVGIFCGIAHPEYFRTTVEKMGAEVVHEYFLPDHDALDLDKLMTFSEECGRAGASWMLCTEKDRVKLSDPDDFKLPVGWVKTRLTVVEGEDHWKSFINQAKMTLKMKS